DKSMEVITRIYAPSSDAELQRVLAADGLVIIVTPGSQHLFGLRQLIYDQVRPHPQPPTPAGLRLSQARQLNFPLSIPAGTMSHALLQMTPFLWRLSAELQERLINNGIEDQADFNLCAYSRDHKPSLSCY